jgi:hypothetical protein
MQLSAQMQQMQQNNQNTMISKERNSDILKKHDLRTIITNGMNPYTNILTSHSNQANQASQASQADQSYQADQADQSDQSDQTEYLSWLGEFQNY